MMLLILSLFLSNTLIIFAFQLKQTHSSSKHSNRLYSLINNNDDKINEIELIKLFGRLADKELLLDIPGAGTPEMMNCCHGGCSNCDYSRIFDSMSSGRPKWIPLYSTRQLIDGRSHISYWNSIFTSSASILDDNVIITKSEFFDQLQKLSYRPSLGIPQSISDTNLELDTLEKFWVKILSYDYKSNNVNYNLETEPNNEQKISSLQMANSLQAITSQSHGATWSDFYKGMTSTTSL